jgi:hypothetical protein
MVLVKVEKEMFLLKPKILPVDISQHADAN